MKKWLRWKGLVAFIIITALLLCFWFILIDTIARKAMEKTATGLVGAEVNISSVDLRLSPLGLSIQGLKVTNPDNPQTNAVEVGKIACSLDTPQLFLRKVIIEEMSITGMAFNTKREKPGFIKKAQKKVKEPLPKKDVLLPTLPGFTKADTATILKEEDLKTLSMIQDIQEETRKQKAFWEKKLLEIPDKEHLNKYQERIEKLREINKREAQSILSAGAEMKSLQDDIKRDINTLKETQTRFNNYFAAINEQMKKVKDAPGEDIRNLVKKYGPTPAGIGNAGALLFGGKIGAWVERALFWYQKINPIIEQSGEVKKGKKVTKPLRAKGSDVHFKEYAPLPDFLIRSATASVTLEAGIVNGTLNNITTGQDILGSPLTFDFSGDKLKGLTSLRIVGSINRIAPGQSIDKLNLSMKGYGLQMVDLGAGTLPITLEKGRVNVDLSTNVLNDIISAELKSTVSSAKLTVPETADTSRLYSSLSSTFSQVNNFSLQASLKGTPDEYTLNLNSDLEKVVAGALNKAVADLAKQFEQDLSAAVQAKTEAPLNALKNDADSLGGIEKELSVRKDFADTLLKKAIATPSQKGSLKLPF